MDDYRTTQPILHKSLIDAPTPEEQRRIDEEQKREEERQREEAHHEIGEGAPGMQDTSTRKHHEIGVGEIGKGLGGTSDIPKHKIGEDKAEEDRQQEAARISQEATNELAKAEGQEIREPEIPPVDKEITPEQIKEIIKQTATEFMRIFATEDSIDAKIDAALPEGLRYINEVAGAGAGDVVKRGISGQWYYGSVDSGGGLDLDSKVCFGYKIDGITVTIYASEINGNVVAETDVTPSAGANSVYVRITKADGTALVAVAASKPANDATYRYYLLYEFNRTDGTVTLTRVARPFLIEDGLPNGGAEYQVMVLDSDIEQTFGWVTKDSIKAAGVTDGYLLQADSSENAVWGLGRMLNI